MDSNILPHVMCSKGRARLTESPQFYLVLSQVFIKKESECHFAISHHSLIHVFNHLTFTRTLLDVYFLFLTSGTYKKKSREKKSNVEKNRLKSVKMEQVIL